MTIVERYQKTDQFTLMHKVIRMVRLGICSHDPPEPEGSSRDNPIDRIEVLRND